MNKVILKVRAGNPEITEQEFPLPIYIRNFHETTYYGLMANKSLIKLFDYKGMTSMTINTDCEFSDNVEVFNKLVMNDGYYSATETEFFQVFEKCMNAFPI